MDLIYRQDAINAINSHFGFNIEEEYGSAVQEVINGLPSAQQEKLTCDLINRRDAIRWVKAECNPYGQPTLDYESGIKVIKHLERMPSAELEPYQEKLKEIAKELSEKFAYLNTCPNERDIILGYLGIKRPYKLHCNTDCIITKCECNQHYTKPPYTESECKCGE